MAQFTLPQNSKIDKKAGKTFKAPAAGGKVQIFKIYRYDPDSGANPRVDSYEVLRVIGLGGSSISSTTQVSVGMAQSRSPARLGTST